MSEYEKSLANWARNLSDDQIAEYITSTKLTDAEWNAVFDEDLHRMRAR